MNAITEPPFRTSICILWLLLLCAVFVQGIGGSRLVILTSSSNRQLDYAATILDGLELTCIYSVISSKESELNKPPVQVETSILTDISNDNNDTYAAQSSSNATVIEMIDDDHDDDDISSSPFTYKCTPIDITTLINIIPPTDGVYMTIVYEISDIIKKIEFPDEYERIDIINIQSHIVTTLDSIERDLVQTECPKDIHVARAWNKLLSHARLVEEIKKIKLSNIDLQVHDVRIEGLIHYKYIYNLLENILSLENSNNNNTITQIQSNMKNSTLLERSDRVDKNKKCHIKTPYWISFPRVLETFIEKDPPSLPEFALFNHENNFKIATVTMIPYNPETYLHLFIESVVYYSDIIIFSDFSVSNETKTIIKTYASKYPNIKFDIINYNEALWPNWQNEHVNYAMIQHAKEYGATHIVPLEIDERFSFTFEKNNLLKYIILGLNQHQHLTMPYIYILHDFKYIYNPSTIKYPSTIDIAYRINDKLSWHGQRVPASIDHPPVIKCMLNSDINDKNNDNDKNKHHRLLMTFKLESMKQHKVSVSYNRHYMLLNNHKVHYNSVDFDVQNTDDEDEILLSYFQNICNISITDLYNAYHNKQIQTKVKYITEWVDEHGLEYFDQAKAYYPKEYFPDYYGYTGWAGIKPPKELNDNYLKCKNFIEYKKNIPPSRKIKIAHIISPVTGDALYKGSFLFEQDVVLDSINRALDHVKDDDTIDVKLIGVIYEDDLPIDKRDFPGLIFAEPLKRSFLDVSFPGLDTSLWSKSKSCNLTRYSTEKERENCIISPVPHCEKCKKLPVMRDVLENGWKAYPDADYIVYTNADIGLQTIFYSWLKTKIIAKSNTCGVSITRRDIIVDPSEESKKIRRNESISEYTNVFLKSGQVETAESKKTGITNIFKTKNHPGHDCLVFPACVLENMFIGDVPIGGMGFGMHTLSEVKRTCRDVEKNNEDLIFLDNPIRHEYKTFHLGNTKSLMDISFNKRKTLPQNILTQKKCREAKKYMHHVMEIPQPKKKEKKETQHKKLISKRMKQTKQEIRQTPPPQEQQDIITFFTKKKKEKRMHSEQSAAIGRPHMTHV